MGPTGLIGLPLLDPLVKLKRFSDAAKAERVAHLRMEIRDTALAFTHEFFLASHLLRRTARRRGRRPEDTRLSRPSIRNCFLDMPQASLGACGQMERDL